MATFVSDQVRPDFTESSLVQSGLLHFDQGGYGWTHFNNSEMVIHQIHLVLIVVLKTKYIVVCIETGRGKLCYHHASLWAGDAFGSNLLFFIIGHMARMGQE